MIKEEVLDKTKKVIYLIKQKFHRKSQDSFKSLRDEYNKLKMEKQKRRNLDLNKENNRDISAI